MYLHVLCRRFIKKKKKEKRKREKELPRFLFLILRLRSLRFSVSSTNLSSTQRELPESKIFFFNRFQPPLDSSDDDEGG